MIHESGHRKERLLDVMLLRVPVSPAVEALHQFPWDSPELVVLDRIVVEAVLTRYLQGEVSAGEIESWAEALEVRDDVGLESERADLLKDMLFELSTPELFGPLSHEVARSWLDRL